MATAYADFSGHFVQTWWIGQSILDDGNHALKVERRKPAFRRLASQTVEPHHLYEELNSLAFHHDHADRIRILEFRCYSLQASLDYCVSKPNRGPQTRHVIGSNRTSDKGGVDGNEQIGPRRIAFIPSTPLTVRWEEDHGTWPARSEGNTSSFDEIFAGSCLALEIYHEGVPLCRHICLLTSQTGSLNDISPHDTPIEMLVNESAVVRATRFAGVEITCFRQ